jgi:hypothetical protein
MTTLDDAAAEARQAVNALGQEGEEPIGTGTTGLQARTTNAVQFLDANAW